MLAFATLGTHQHLRLNAAEVKRRCPWLPFSFAAAPHCLDEANVLELVRVDLGGPAGHVARKCAADLLGHYGWPRCRFHNPSEAGSQCKLNGRNSQLAVLERHSFGSNFKSTTEVTGLLTVLFNDGCFETCHINSHTAMKN